MRWGEAGQGWTGLEGAGQGWTGLDGAERGWTGLDGLLSLNCDMSFNFILVKGPKRARRYLVLDTSLKEGFCALAPCGLKVFSGLL